MIKNIIKNSSLILLGIAIGVGVSVWFYFEKHKQTEIWSTKSDISLENGTVIPKNTNLILNCYMPEGFASLQLDINADSEVWELFEKKQENKSFLSIPYWIKAENRREYNN